MEEKRRLKLIHASVGAWCSQGAGQEQPWRWSGGHQVKFRGPGDQEQGGQEPVVSQDTNLLTAFLLR